MGASGRTFTKFRLALRRLPRAVLFKAYILSYYTGKRILVKCFAGKKNGAAGCKDAKKPLCKFHAQRFFRAGFTA